MFPILEFLYPLVLVCFDYVFRLKIDFSIFYLGKGRILAASACPCRAEERAREGKDACTCRSSLIMNE